MKPIVFIIITTSHKDLNESLSIVKGNQYKFLNDITVHDMSYLKGHPLDKINLNKVKSIIEFHRKINLESLIHIIGDEEQFNSILGAIGGRYTNPTPMYVEMGNSIPLI